MERAEYVSTIPRALLALIGGAVTGTVAFLLEIAVLLAVRPNKLGEINDYIGTTSSDLFLVFTIYGFIFFAGGLLIVGAPLWWGLHRMKRRNWYDAAGLGVVLGAAGFVFIGMWDPNWAGLSVISFITEEFGGITAANDQLTRDGWEALFRGPFITGIAGAFVGLAIWRIAYRKSAAKTSAPASG